MLGSFIGRKPDNLGCLHSGISRNSGNLSNLVQEIWIFHRSVSTEAEATVRSDVIKKNSHRQTPFTSPFFNASGISALRAEQYSSYFTKAGGLATSKVTNLNDGAERSIQVESAFVFGVIFNNKNINHEKDGLKSLTSYSSM